MSKPVILHAGTVTKAEILRAYATGGPHFGRALARRYLYDVAHAIVEIHGHGEAAAALYEIGDAVAAKLPLKDWQDFAKPSAEPASPDKPLSTQKRVALAFNAIGRGVEAYKFWIGLFIGLLLGERV